MRNKVEEKMMKNEIDENTFVEAQESIYKLMENDSFPRFKKTYS